MLTKTEQANLKELLPPATCIYLTVVHVSASGMSRDIKRLIKTDDGIRDISWHVSRALGYSLKNDAVRIGGCGMDMGLALADIVSYTLYGVPVDQRNDRAVRDNEPATGGVRYKWL